MRHHLREDYDKDPSAAEAALIKPLAARLKPCPDEKAWISYAAKT